MLFHLAFNVALAVAVPLLHRADRAHRRAPAAGAAGRATIPAKPRHLDPSALATPALAISCAAREALRIGDVIEEMLNGMLTVLKTNDRALAERLRKMDDVVDELYTAVKLYLTQISREALEEKEGRRWADIVSFTINMEQVGDIIERIIIDVEDKKIDKGRNFSEAGMAEICDLHARLIANLRLGLSVFLNGDLKSAQELLAQKVLFRDLERAYAELAPRAARRPDRREHRDLVAASRPHLRPAAHQFAHLLDRLSDPRGGRRARRRRASRSPMPAVARRAARDAPGSRRKAAWPGRLRALRRRAHSALRRPAALIAAMPASELTLGVTLAVLGAGCCTPAGTRC